MSDRDDPRAPTPAPIPSASPIPIIELKGVSRRFTLHHERPASFHELFVRTLERRPPQREEFWALKDISLAVFPGDALGIVGPNGSGKSTLLKLIAGLMQPSHGSVAVYGSVAALLEVGAGFHPDLSGRENIRLNGAFLGLDRKRLAAITPEIVAFSGLGEFIDVPVKHYSSGMYMRLGFSIAIHVDPDILITDEVFAVGDDAFRAKCEGVIADFRKRGKTLLFVSHALAQVLALCDRAIWLEKGEVMGSGSAEQVARLYRASSRATSDPAAVATGADDHAGRESGDPPRRQETAPDPAMEAVSRFRSR